MNRHFVPLDFDASDLNQVTPLYQALIDRPIDSGVALGRWLLDVSELSSVMDEYGARRYIDKSCHTDDPAIEARYLQYVETIEPATKPLFFAIQRKFLESPHLADLKDARHAMVARRWEPDVTLFREANVPLETKVVTLNAACDKINGAMLVAFEGKERTMQQMARFGEQTDRPMRQGAWEAATERRLRDHDAIETIFDALLALRKQISANAGLDHYRSFIWRAYKRFDYAPEQCLAFADAIEKACVPLTRALDRERREALGLERLKPWDTSVDPLGRPPLEPFKEDEIPQFVAKTKAIFERMSPALAADFDGLRVRGNLDLGSRPGKQPGGYQYSLEEAREPFIFMNAAGLHRDVEVLLHEGGHAFHCLAARDEPLVFLRSAPMEFCEVASMSMELLGADHFDVFYPAADAARAKRSLMEGIIRFLPWMATIDSFQHWLYTHPDHTAAERTTFWLSLLDRFGGDVDWTGQETARASSWHKQLHLFHAPFYYIEYGIAQLGALQLWMKSRTDPRAALSNYRAALALGGTRSLPELFAAAGIEFDFSPRTLLPLMDALRTELAELPR